MEVKLQSSWVTPPHPDQFKPVSLNGELPPAQGRTFLPVGALQSFGDCCHSASGWLLSSENNNQILRFNPENGILRCGSGTTLKQVVDAALPAGWTLPVMPGTRRVTIGGSRRLAIAYATSIDTIKWTPALGSDSSPYVLGPNQVTKTEEGKTVWDSFEVRDPTVLVNPDRKGFLMWYTGTSKSGASVSPPAIGMAASEDGRTWEREPSDRPQQHTDPVIKPLPIYG